MNTIPINAIITKQTISDRIIELGKQITADYCYRNNAMVLIGMMRGSFIFIADLCRVIKIPHEIDFITVSSYRNSKKQSKNIRIIKGLDENIEDKDVLIVEDIIDSGNTLENVQRFLKTYGPRSISICVLLNKLRNRDTKLKVDYVGFYIPDIFVVGYGIDYAQSYRHLPYIAKL